MSGKQYLFQQKQKYTKKQINRKKKNPKWGVASHPIGWIQGKVMSKAH